MTTPTTPLRNWEQELKEEKPIDFHTSRSDSGHIIVSRHKGDGTKETIGHVYVEVNDDEIKYFCTNQKGREIFPPTTDFNLVEMNYDRYARLFAIRGKTKENNKQLNITNQFKNPTIMKNQTQSPEPKSKKVNQLIFVEYEKAAGDGHLITVVDSYRNVIGRIHKSFNDETKKYEYISYDHAGNLMGQNEKLWQLKNEFTNNREQLLEQAHQRRIVSRENAKEKSQTPQITKQEDRKKETQELRNGKSSQEKQVSQTQTKPSEMAGEKEDSRTGAKENAHENGEQNRQEEREQELEDLRDEREDDDRGDMDIPF